MNMESSFIHLHNHSEFSILDGALKTAALVEAAYQNKMPAVALTDHGNIFGAISFVKQAMDKKIKPILGCEIYVAPESRFDKDPNQKGPRHYHLILLVKEEKGYRNLCQLLAKSYLEGFYYKPRIDKELLVQHSEGLIGLSACLKGEISYYLSLGLDDKSEEAALEYAAFFAPGDFYIELMDHGLEAQKEINPKLVKLAKKLDLPLVATNDVHYLQREDAESQDTLLCIQTNKRVTDQDRIRFATQEFYFKSNEEMAVLFRDVPEAIQNTTKIAAECNFVFPFSGYSLPNFRAPEDMSLSEYFDQVVRRGFEDKMKGLMPRIENGELPGRKVYERRLEKEIRLVKEMGFEGYFLIVGDIIREARSKNIPVGPGRGSAAGSLLAFSLGITAIDPLEYDLLFERFLNPERISLPDIDIDFCGRRRDEVLSYVTQKYGRENVCQIITFGTMAARQAVRDVGRALEVPLPEVDKIAKMIPPLGPDSTIEGALRNIPQLREMRDKDAKIAHLLSVAQKLEGQVRHPSIHAAGIVITPKPLVEFMPLYQSVKGEITTQFPMGDIEAIGLLKMDLLGLRNLTVIQDTVDLVKKDSGEEINIEHIPLNDGKTFEVFQSGNTDGVFQFESAGMKDLLRNYKPESLRDLIALNALYRPGPLKSGMTDEFIKRKNHPDRISYELPELELVLKETRGIIVYQEQVMQIATELAGYSVAEADILRKAMGKKIASVMKAQKQRFIRGAKEKGVSQAKANKIFELVKNFAGYGFNKSHSAAYAFLAFHTAYLKAHYPVHFLAALLTSEAERGATSQVVKYINECKEMGIKVLPPDINESDFNFTFSKGNIRFGLSAIKNVGEGAIRALIKAREKRGRFKSPFDIFGEADPKTLNRKVIESLIKAGALDSLGWKRSQMFHLVDELIDFAHDIQRINSSRQSLLFGWSQIETPQIPHEVQEMREWDEPLFLSYEKDALGFYITGHPLTQYGKQLTSLVSHSISQLDDEKDFNNEIKVAGIISSVKPLKTKKDERMATFILEDLSGRIEVVVFPDSYKKYYEFLRQDSPVWIKGRFLGEGESRRIHLLQIMPLEEAFQKQAKRVVFRIFLPGIEETIFEELKAILEKNQGNCPVFFELEKPHSYRMVVQSRDIQGVVPSEELLKDIENLLGENSVYVEY
ncbi:MAG: DNA polymerase III subunit alpha [Candidatus Aminicenantes bacterium]|nr:DNA polymerase III subunit alpha [Candidatus Aminicenantes bacterium]MDH5742964.1 DNA polymerase III subunit alpha [Candidatus Aminicenantes bacterium]